MSIVSSNILSERILKYLKDDTDYTLYLYIGFLVDVKIFSSNYKNNNKL